MKPSAPILPVQYLMVSEKDHLWGNVITTAGFQHIQMHTLYPPANHPAHYSFSTSKGRIIDEYQLLYIVRGSGQFVSAAAGSIRLKEGTILLLFPGEWHNYKPDDNTGWDEYWIGFNGSVMNDRVKNGFFQPEKPVYEIGIQEEIIQLYKKAIETAQAGEAGFQQKLSGIVSNLLGHIYYIHRTTAFEQTDIANKINKAKAILAEKFNTEIAIEEVAAQVQMSYSWFRHSFKAYTGFSPNQYILELRIQRSKILLTNSVLSIKEIAWDVGFDNSEYYTTIFRKRTAMTPGAYRRFTQGKAPLINFL